jgi:hypothetical protein
VEDLNPFTLVIGGIGVLLIWGGISGQSPVGRIKSILTRGGTQSAPATTTTATSVSTSATYTVRRDYLA